MPLPKKHQTRRINVGNIPVGGGSPVSVQSMTNVPTRDVSAAVRQILELADAGCDIVRLAVPDLPSAEALKEIIPQSPVPIVADIHFNYNLAILSITAGVHAVRINPGNIGNPEKVKMVADAAGNAGIPIRVGVNAGSLPKGLYDSLLKETNQPDEALARALCEAALGEIAQLDACGFKNYAVSLKASSVPVTVAAYRLFSERSDAPLHVGVTEAGTPYRGIMKSAAGIGTLLLEGIGDTIRVSLTAPPPEEVRAGIALLEALELRRAEPEIVSCPTCARTLWDLFGMTERVEKLVQTYKNNKQKLAVRKIAVMGCVVNGPGEARDADIGLAGSGAGNVTLFRFGKPFATLSPDEAFQQLKNLLDEAVIR